MRRKLQWLILWRLVIAVTLLATVAIIEQGNSVTSFTPTLLIQAVVVGAFSVGYFLLLKSRISFDNQIFAQLVVDMLLVTWLVHRTGDVESPFPALYMVIIFAATALLSRKAVFTLAVIGGALYLANGVLRILNVIPRATLLPALDSQRPAPSEFLLLLNVIAIFAVTILASRLAGHLRRSEKELAIATRDLADYRAFNDRIIESMRSGLMTTDLRGTIITFNRAAEEITGYKSSEVKGSSLFTIFGDIGKQIEVGLESIRTRSRLPRFDISCCTATGKEIHLGFSVAPLVDESRPEDEPETPRGYVLTFQDLTEVMELEREVRRQERLAALGKMAAGLAHEIRNPLASMRGSVQVLAGELDLMPDQAQLMEIVLRESDRLNRIVSDFLVYARPPRIERALIDLPSIISETLALLRHSPELSPEHLISEIYDPEVVLYNGDPNQLRQVFWNLARNAIQAMPSGGELVVELEAPPGQDVTITFRDDGEGMSREQRERLFEPFNSSTGGTGLGMAIVYQLVHDHNGKILVDSEAGKGTRISIKLPADGRASNPLEYHAGTDSIALPS